MDAASAGERARGLRSLSVDLAAPQLGDDIRGTCSAAAVLQALAQRNQPISCRQCADVLDPQVHPMQMVYKAKDIQDAHTIRDVLARSGITAHLAEPASEIGVMAPGFIRVSVDNDRLDAARRAIAASYRTRKVQHF